MKNLTREGGNQPGGAFLFKNNYFVPYAIHNNTLWHNALIFANNWKANPGHLLFNNIISEPVEYWRMSDIIFANHLESSALFDKQLPVLYILSHVLF